MNQQNDQLSVSLLTFSGFIFTTAYLKVVLTTATMAFIHLLICCSHTMYMIFIDSQSF